MYVSSTAQIVEVPKLKQAPGASMGICYNMANQLPASLNMDNLLLLFKNTPSLNLKNFVAQEKSCAVPSISYCMEATLCGRMMRHHSLLTCIATSLPVPPLIEAPLKLHDLHKSNLTFRCKLRQCPMSCRVLHLLPPSSYQGQIRHT